jgi:hypothetical protein
MRNLTCRSNHASKAVKRLMFFLLLNPAGRDTIQEHADTAKDRTRKEMMR